MRARSALVRTKPRRLRCPSSSASSSPDAAYSPGTVCSGSAATRSNTFPMNRSVSGKSAARSTRPFAVTRPLARRVASEATTGAMSDRRNASSVALIGSVTAGRRGVVAIRHTTAKTIVVANAARYPYPAGVIASMYRSIRFSIDITSPPGSSVWITLPASKPLTGHNFQAKPRSRGPAEPASVHAGGQESLRTWWGLSEENPGGAGPADPLAPTPHSPDR